MAAGPIVSSGLGRDCGQTLADFRVQRVGADRPLVIGFCNEGETRSAFEHENILSQVAGQSGQGFHRILVRDGEGLGYYRGIPGLGDSIEEAADALRGLIAEINPSHLITFGTGLGAHAALVYGILLRAARIVAVEPVAHLIAEELALLNDRRWQAQVRELPDPMLARRYDVASLAAESGFQGSAFILYGTQHRNEHEEAVPLGVLHAYWLARHEHMTLCPFFDRPGNLWEALIRGSEAMEVLRRYLFGEPTSTASQSLAHSGTSQHRSGRGLAHYHFDVTLLAVDEAEAEADPARAEAIPDRYAAIGKLEAPPIRGVDNGWRSWIAENLMLGASPNTMEATMAARGIPHEQAAAEIRDALQSPYFWGAQRLCNRLKKRDWQLATYRKLQRLRPGSNRLERRSRLSQEEFLKAHESTGRPVIMSGMFEVGDASSRWTFAELLRRHGGCMVALEVDSTQGEDGHPLGMTLLGHVERMRGAAPGQNYVLKLLDGPHNHPILEEFSHRLGSIPEFVADSPVLEQTLLLGERGSISPFRDLVKDQYLAQMIGHIRVRIVPSWDSPLMKNTHDQASELDGRMAPDSGLSPALDQPQILNAVLNPGDFLFLPAGTWLFVEAREAFAAVSMARSGVGDDLASRFPRERKM